MGFNPIFYAGSTKLSEVTIDSDLDMGGRNISGVDTLRADLIRAGQVDAPYMPQTWPTETLGWGDVPESIAVSVESAINVSTPSSEFEVLTWETPDIPYRWEVHLKIGGHTGGSMTLSFVSDDTTIHSLVVRGGQTHTISLVLPHSATVSLLADNASAHDQRVNAGSYVKNTGLFAGAKTFDLTGKWLALGLDMHGLAATVKIHGVDIPYSDYAKYFPLAPTELTFPSDWSPSQIRPIVKVYK